MRSWCVLGCKLAPAPPLPPWALPPYLHPGHQPLPDLHPVASVSLDHTSCDSHSLHATFATLRQGVHDDLYRRTPRPSASPHATPRDARLPTRAVQPYGLAGQGGDAGGAYAMLAEQQERMRQQAEWEEAQVRRLALASSAPRLLPPTRTPASSCPPRDLCPVSRAAVPCHSCVCVCGGGGEQAMDAAGAGGRGRRSFRYNRDTPVVPVYSVGNFINFITLFQNLQ
jgi:hypothetical protein